MEITKGVAPYTFSFRPATQIGRLRPLLVMMPSTHLLRLATAAIGAVLLWAQPAQADTPTPVPVLLDYQATDPSCADADRFADEVSAKLGFVPWSGAGAGPGAAPPRRIKIRLGRDGAGFTGSFRHHDGTAKILDGASCAEVSAALVLTVATALDRGGVVEGGLGLRGGLGVPRGHALAALRAEPRPAPRPSDDGKISVTFVTADRRRVDVSLNNGGGVGRASDGSTVSVNYFDGLCTSPCTTRLPRGRHYLMFQDPDARAVGGGKFLFDEPTTITLTHRSRRSTRRKWLVGGSVMAAGGLLGLIALPGAGPKILSGVGMSLGMTGMLVPLFMHDTFDATTTPTR